jgi:hypothetical protein
MHFIRRLRFDHVTIVGDASRDSLGHVHAGLSERVADRIANGDLTRRQLASQVQVLFGGLVAEKIFTGRDDWHGATYDLDAAVDLVMRHMGSADACEKYLERQQRQTEAHLNGHWPKVTTLAAALLETPRLSYQEARGRIWVPSLQPRAHGKRPKAMAKVRQR